MVDWYLGTMGFGYKDWEGGFYPTGLGARDYLAYYSRYFNAVEMDTTFYGVPRHSIVEQWGATTPDEFRFCAKTPRLVTHDLGLVNATAIMDEFFNSLRVLGDKMGIVLVQLPPGFTATKKDALEAFLDEVVPLAKGIHIAVEFRHISWHAPQTADLLQHHGVCWAATEFPGLPRQIHLTTDFLYIRWIGQHGTYDKHQFERVDKTDELKLWYEQLSKVLDHITTVYGFFNNDYAGFAAGTCYRFKSIAGIPAKPFQPPQQDRLF